MGQFLRKLCPAVTLVGLRVKRDMPIDLILIKNMFIFNPCNLNGNVYVRL